MSSDGPPPDPEGAVDAVVRLLIAAAGEQEAQGRDALARSHLLHAQQLAGALHRRPRR